MRKDKELFAIHNTLREHIGKYDKFEERLAVVKNMIRFDYHTLELKQSVNQLFSRINDGIKIIKIDTTTPEKVYHDVIKKIYETSNLKTFIKDTRKFTKEERLLLLVDIYFLNSYFNYTQENIIDKLVDFNDILDRQNKNLSTKELRIYLKLVKDIKADSNNITEY